MTPTEHAHMMKLRETLKLAKKYEHHPACGVGLSGAGLDCWLCKQIDAALSLPVPSEPTQTGEEWRPLSQAPKEHFKDIRVRYVCETNAFWADDLQRFVISRGPIHVESICATDRYLYRAALQAALGVKP